MAIDSPRRPGIPSSTSVSTDGGDSKDLEALSNALKMVRIYCTPVTHQGRPALRIMNPYYVNASILVWVAESRTLRHFAKPQGLSFGSVMDVRASVGEVRRCLQSRR